MTDCGRTNGLPTAVIVTYNGTDWIARCLASLAEAGVDRVVVVDNASTDGTADLVRRAGPGVALIPLRQNVGFGAGNNIGIQAAFDAGATRILLVNQDIDFAPDAVRLLAGAADRHPEYGVLSALQLTPDGLEVDPSFRLYLPNAYYNDLVIRGGPKADVYPCPFVPAACVLIPRSVWAAVGGFDPLFFLYSEDNDLCKRIVDAGWRLGIVPSARANHWHGLIRRAKSFGSRANMSYSRTVYDLKWLGRSITLGRAWRRVIESTSVRAAAAELLGIVRSVTNYRRIVSGRGAIPHRFADRQSEGTIPPPARGRHLLTTAGASHA